MIGVVGCFAMGARGLGVKSRMTLGDDSLREKSQEEVRWVEK